MENPITPAVEILLDRPRHLHFDFNALVALEKATGRNVLADGLVSDAGSGAGLKVSAADLRAMLWAGLLRDDPALTLEQAGRLIDVGNMGYVSDKIAEAWAFSLPAKDPQTPAPEPEPPPAAL